MVIKTVVMRPLETRHLECPSHIDRKEQFWTHHACKLACATPVHNSSVPRGRKHRTERAAHRGSSSVHFLMRIRVYICLVCTRTLDCRSTQGCTLLCNFAHSRHVRVIPWPRAHKGACTATLSWWGGRGAGKGVPPLPPQRRRPAGDARRPRAGPSLRRAAHLRTAGGAADTAHGWAGGTDRRATGRF